MTNQFIWADLSTFDIAATRHFYHQCFGWAYSDIGDGYMLCESQGHAAAGIYTMPEKFQKIGMPSFWMSYIRVQDIQATVRAAEANGAKIEVQPEPAPGGGMIALIRDPSGAGFTCYEGNDLGGRSETEQVGRMVWNELHVSSLDKVAPFYSNVFGWVIEASGDTDRYDIYKPTDPSFPIAGIQVTSNDIKGDKEYWGVYFSVADLAETSGIIERNGGEIVAQQPLGDRPAVLAYDPQGAAFYIV